MSIAYIDFPKDYWTRVHEHDLLEEYHTQARMSDVVERRETYVNRAERRRAGRPPRNA